MRGSGGKGKSGKKYDSPSNNRRSTPKGVYIMDKTLIPRLKQYLSQFRKGYVPDVEEMTSYLQSRYGDYSRKKRHVFKSSVQKAYQAISIEDKESRYLQKLENKFLQIKNNSDSMYDAQEDKIQTDDDTSDSEVSLTEEPLIELQGNNLMNQSMQSMYKLSRPTSDAEDDPCNDSRVDQNSNKDQDSSASMKQPIPIIASTPMETAVNKQMTETVLMDEQCTPAVDIQKSSESQNKRKTNEEKADMADTPRQSKKRRKRQESKKDEDDNLPQFLSTTSTVKFADIGGCDDAIEQVCKMLIHMRHPEVFSTLGITPPRGFLLHGPPGCGKTLLAHAIAGELELPFLKLAATEIVSGVSGESEEKVRDLFNSAVAQAPCVMFIDEIDAITPKRETASKDMERRIVSQLLTCMDDLNNNPSVQVLVVGATNRPDSLDPALRRAGRFDREICMGIPDQKARERVLQVLCKQLKLNEDFSYSALACLTPGFVGADLMALTREAAMVAVNRVFQGLEETAKPGREESTSSYVNRTEDKKIQQTEKTPEHSHVMEWLKNQPPLTEEQLGVLSIAMDDFKAALLTVQPSAKREGFATIPDVTWKDVGALKDVREELTMAILAPVQHPEEFAALGLSHPPGILLAGPPGCGKTLLAKAIANESGINFISVKGPELLNMYVGESERAVRQVFQRARNSSPCVIFFDELDALCPRRSGSSESGVSVRVVNQLLTEMDGLEARKQVFIMAATNRPDIIDPAVVRPGRLDKILYVGLPSPDDRKDILTTITKNGSKPLLLPDVDLDKIAISERSTGYSGADLSALVREASMAALRERIDTSSIRVDGATTDKLPTVGVGERHFEIAFSRVKPSVSKKDQSMYEEIKTFASKI